MRWERERDMEDRGRGRQTTRTVAESPVSPYRPTPAWGGEREGWDGLRMESIHVSRTGSEERIDVCDMTAAKQRPAVRCGSVVQ